MRRRFAIAAALVLSATAHAAPLTVEGPSVSERVEAISIARLVRAAGMSPRVERRYHHGDGWRWHVVIRGFADPGAALETANQVSALTGRSHAVYADRGQGTLPSPSGPDVQVPLLGAVGATSDALLRARRAHGPVDLLERVQNARELTFQYVRTLGDGRQLRHVYQRQGSSVSLRIDDVERSVSVLQLRVDGDVAQVVTGEGWQSRDVHRVRETLDRLGPEVVLRPALVLPRALVEHRELALARPVGTDTAGNALYAFAGTGDLEPAQMSVEPASGRVVRLALGTADRALVRELSGAVQGGSVSVPQTLRTLRAGQVLDDVRVEIFELSSKLMDPAVITPET